MPHPVSVVSAELAQDILDRLTVGRLGLAGLGERVHVQLGHHGLPDFRGEHVRRQRFGLYRAVAVDPCRAPVPRLRRCGRQFVALDLLGCHGGALERLTSSQPANASTSSAAAWNSASPDGSKSPTCTTTVGTSRAAIRRAASYLTVSESKPPEL